MVLYSRELALQRLQKLSLPYSSADSVLSLILKNSSKGHTEEETLEKALLFLDPFLSDYTGSGQTKAPIFELIEGPSLSTHLRPSIQIKDLLLSDHARFPVFHVEFKDKEDSKDFPVAPLTRTGSRKDSRKNMNKRSSVRFERSQNKCTLSVFSIPIIY